MNKHARRVSVIILIGILALSTFGCQPNPTTPPVVGKGNLEDKIKDKTAAPSQTPAGEAVTGSASATDKPAIPQQVKSSLQSGKLIVNIDAVMELPTVSKLPVVKVAPRKFTQAEASTVIKVLFQGKPAYKPKEIMTKDELNKEIVRMKAMKLEMKDNKNAQTKLNAVIDNYEKQLPTAPDKVERVVSDGKFATDELDGQDIYVTTPLGKTVDANLNIYNSKSSRTCSVWFTNEEQGESYMGNEAALTGTPRGVKMPLDQAKALAEQTVKDMGSDLKLSGTGIGTSRELANGKPTVSPDARQTYIFAFSREVNGVPSTYESDFGGNIPQDDIDRADTSKEFIESHPYERIVMVINDTGIVELQWTSPDTVLDTVSSDVQTLPFEQILQTFDKQFFIMNALKTYTSKPGIEASSEVADSGDYSAQLRQMGIFTKDSIGDGKNVKTCTYNIDRITLGLTRIAVKDKQNEFMMVPVYDFFGTVKVEYTPESGIQGFVSAAGNTSFLTINAIDGSIINRSYGY